MLLITLVLLIMTWANQTNELRHSRSMVSGKFRGRSGWGLAEPGLRTQMAIYYSKDYARGSTDL